MVNVWIEYVKENKEEGKKLIEALGGKIIKDYEEIEYFYADFVDGRLNSERDIISTLLNSKMFRTIKEDSKLFLFGVEPEDIEISSEEIIYPDEYNRLIEQDLVVREGYRGEGIKVAVLDSGVNLEELESDVKIVPLTEDIKDDIGHGTAIVDILTKVAEGLEAIYVGKVTRGDGTKYYIDTKVVMDYLEKLGEMGVDVINISFGGTEPDDGKHPLSKMVDYLSEKKHISVVCAVGNGYGRKISYPASAKYSIVVGAVDREGKPAKFNCDGYTLDGRLKLDIMAYGVNILVKSKKVSGMKINDEYKIVSGTSFACPMVAGVITLLRSYENLGDKVKEAIFKTADKSFMKKTELAIVWNNIFEKLMDRLGIRLVILRGTDEISVRTMGNGIVRAYKALRYLMGKRKV
jgi:hypothetical protein